MRVRLPKQALQYKPKGRRNKGRPRKRWRDQLHLEDQGTGNMPKPSGTWWWWWWWWQNSRLSHRSAVTGGVDLDSLFPRIRYYDWSPSALEKLLLSLKIFPDPLEFRTFRMLNDIKWLWEGRYFEGKGVILLGYKWYTKIYLSAIWPKFPGDKNLCSQQLINLIMLL